MIDKPKKSALLRDTNSGPSPGDFPVGSAESRAAARNVLQLRERARRAANITWIITYGLGDALPEPNFHTWDGHTDLWSGRGAICAHDDQCAVCREGFKRYRGNAGMIG